jgi:hypothetical protein
MPCPVFHLCSLLQLVVADTCAQAVFSVEWLYALPCVPPVQFVTVGSSRSVDRFCLCSGLGCCLVTLLFPIALSVSVPVTGLCADLST